MVDNFLKLLLITVMKIGDDYDDDNNDDDNYDDDDDDYDDHGFDCVIQNPWIRYIYFGKSLKTFHIIMTHLSLQ